MRKKIFIITIILFFAMSLFAKKIKDKDMAMDVINDTTLQKVLEVNGSKEVILEKLEEWIKKEFNDPIDKIIEINQEQFYIIGFGNLILTYKEKWTYNYYFDYKFEVKDNKIRFTMENPFRIRAHMQYSGEDFIDTGKVEKAYISGKELRKFSNMIKIKKVIDELIDHINGTVKEDTDW